MSEESYEQDRLIFEQKPRFSVWQPELGHLPYAAMRFERHPEDETLVDFYVTVGGGFPTDLEDVAGFFRDVADMIEEVAEMDSEKEPEEPDGPEWFGGADGFM